MEVGEPVESTHNRQQYPVFSDYPTSLPDSYGDHHVVILVRDPSCLFAYWELQSSRMDHLRGEWGAALDGAAFVLRVFDVTETAEDRWSQAPSFDIDLPYGAAAWYIPLSRPARRHRVEIGWRLKDGRFVSIVTSNVVLLPLGRVSDEVDAQWVAVRMSAEYAEWEKIMQSTEVGRGSAEFSKTMAQRWQFLKSVFSLSFPPSSHSIGVSSLPSSKSGSGSRQP